MSKENISFETAYEWWKTQDKLLKIVEAVSGRFCVLYRNKWYVHPPHTRKGRSYSYGPYGAGYYYTSEESAEEVAVDYITYEYRKHLKKGEPTGKLESEVECPRVVKEY